MHVAIFCDVAKDDLCHGFICHFHYLCLCHLHRPLAKDFTFILSYLVYAKAHV